MTGTKSVRTARTVGVEDTSDTDVDAILTLIIVGQGLGDTFPLIITSTNTDGVDIAPAIVDVV